MKPSKHVCGLRRTPCARTPTTPAEYFLTQFADQKAHDGGEFLTPVSLVSLIAHVLEPGSGTVLDPACGSGGMFVQSARVVERHHENPAEKLTFYGLEKNATTIRRAKMNLAVHGLEGDIQRAISYYEDSHELLGKAGYVMANPRVGSSILPPATIRSVAYRSKHTCQKFLCVNFA